MSNSTHKVEVVRLEEILPHPNADRLEITNVFGYPCCIRKGEFKSGDLIAYLPPDSVVPNTEQFEFLNSHRRIKAKRLRGEVSMGLIIAAPTGSQEGDDVAELLGITHYDPPTVLYSFKQGGSLGKQSLSAPSPDGWHPVYDVDALRRYKDLFQPDELVSCSEKIHGANLRATFVDGKLHVGSRTRWKQESDSDAWWIGVKKYPGAIKFLEENPQHTLYGELYGQVQDLKYGISPEERFRIAFFDIMRPSGEFCDIEIVATWRVQYDIPWVPILKEPMEYNFEEVCKLAEGPSTMPGASHIREGCVVKPLVERKDSRIGRVILKVVGIGYLERP